MTASVGEILRHEKAILKPESYVIESGCGGTLTLTKDWLTWKASRWRLLQFIGDKGFRVFGAHAPPKLLEFDLRKADFAIGSPRHVSAILFGPLILLQQLVSGGRRKTLEVVHARRVRYFAVKDAAAWLEDIGRARGDG